MTRSPFNPQAQSSVQSERDFILTYRTLSSRGAPVTYALLVIFVIVYAISLYITSKLVGVSSQPITGVLVLLGAMNPQAVLSGGQTFRLLTATLLHGSILHLLLNGYALFIVGRFLEPLLGKFWFFAAFGIGGLAGSLLGLKTNAANVISVGASGAIMGLFTLLGLVSFRVPQGALRRALRVDALQVLIPSLVPLGISIGGAKIDYAAHLGGALGGVAAATILFPFWPKGEAQPAQGSVAKFFAMITLCLYLWAIGETVSSLREILNLKRSSHLNFTVPSHA